MKSSLQRYLPRTVFERNLALQHIFAAFAQGIFLTGAAIFFTRIVGLTGAQVGLGMSAAGIFSLAFQLPMGRLTDQVGAKRIWAIGSALEAGLYALWPEVRGMATFAVSLAVLTLVEAGRRNARNVYRLLAFSPKDRVRANALMRTAQNIGFTGGAAACGLAIGVGSSVAIRAIPLVTAALLALNALLIVCTLPHLADDSPSHEVQAVEQPRLKAWKNTGFVGLSICNGILASNQILLDVVIPLWIVERTSVPRTMLALLVALNTAMVVALQIPASRSAGDVNGSVRTARLATRAFVLSCVVVAMTHDTSGTLCVAMLVAGHIMITAAELWQSASEWGFTSLLSDPSGLGEYQGVWAAGRQISDIITPGLYTFLALNLGDLGWVIIAIIVITSSCATNLCAKKAHKYIYANLAEFS